MAAEWDTSLPLEENEDREGDDASLLLSHSQGNNNNMMNEKEDDFIAELTHHMDRFFLQDDDDDDDDDHDDDHDHDIHKSHLSPIGSSHNFSELSWELMSPQSTLWSPLGSNQGSSEGSSQEPSPPHTPHNKNNNAHQHPSWRNSLFDIHGFNNNSNSNIGLCSSYQSLIHQQIRAIELSRLKPEQVLTLKPKASAYGEIQSDAQIDWQKSEAKEQIDESESDEKKGDESGVGRRRRRRRRRNPPRPAPLLLQIQAQQQKSGAPATMRAVFLGGSGSIGGTGVFLPRAAASAAGAYAAPPESTMKQGKGCSTVLIPARVVQALQQHFDQMAATSKPPAFPPLHDVLVSNRDGMYSIQNQKRRSRKAPATASIKEEMILPQDWTY